MSKLKIPTQPSFQVDQEDGARWSIYEDQSDIRRFTILTSSGGELMNGPQKEQLESLVQQYRAAELGGVALDGTSPDIRQELGRGQEAIVYRLGPYAVREEKSIKGVYVALAELSRMDAINDVIDEGLPRWLNLPAHYILHSDPSTQKTYTLMDRIDGGITVEDIVNYPSIPDAKAEAVQKEVGEHLEDAQEKVPPLYDRAHKILSDAIESKGKSPDKFLTDWHERNVIVERQHTPVAGSNYLLNVIDQYRS